MLKPLTEAATVPLSGGCVTRHHKAILPFGAFSDMKNLRGENPGFRKRPGQIKLHTTADGSNEVLSMYQFRKRRIDETHFFAQFSDGDVLEATNDPPTVTTGVFGAEVFSGAGTGEVPASYSVIDDVLLYSNGVDQHQTFSGDDNFIDAFVIYNETTAAPNVPEEGLDFTSKVTDGLAATAAVLDSLGSNVNNAIFICTPVAATKLTWTISLPNGNSVTSTLSYRKNDNTWADTNETNNTLDTGRTLFQTGTMTWTKPGDEIPCFMYGQSGYWYRLTFSGALDAEVEVTKLTFGSDFQDLANVWNGVIPYIIEAMHFDDSADLYKTYGAAAVNIRLMEQESGAGNDDKDRLYFSSFDPIKGIYIDVGATPNTAVTAVVYGIKAWTGSGFVTVGTIQDGTNGLTNSGWITWPELAAAEPSQFKSTQYYAYWYYLWIGTAELSSSVNVSIYTMPYFDIERLGKGLCSVAWKDMAAYVFTNFSNYIYITEPGMVTALNGQSFGILRAGDGRTNKVVAMRKFYNELLCFQEEKGVEGGTITLFQGYSPATFGKLLINSNIGTFSNKTVAVVDGVMTSTETEEAVRTMCFFLSRYGICTTDGLSVSIISDDIQNYFDPTKPECIRRGYEDKMWLNHDKAFNVIRAGLVSGDTATKPNVFPVFDLVTKTWSFDTPAQELSCLVEVEAGSGDIIVLQVGGGIDDGFVYLLNNTADDVDTAIDSFFTMELNARGSYIQLSEMVLRAEAVSLDDELVTGGVDMGNSDWTSYGSPETNEQATHDGQTNCRHIVDSAPSYGGILSTTGWTTTTGTTYQYSFKAKVISGSIDVRVRRGDGGAYIAIESGIDPAGWTIYSGTLEEPAGGASAVFQVFNASNTVAAEFYIDEVSVKKVAAGDVTVTFSRNTILAGIKTLSLSPEIEDQSVRRHRFMLNIDDQNISIKVQNNQSGREMLLLDMGIKTATYEER